MSNSGNREASADTRSATEFSRRWVAPTLTRLPVSLAEEGFSLGGDATLNS